jgi:hypothetical protein
MASYYPGGPLGNLTSKTLDNGHLIFGCLHLRLKAMSLDSNFPLPKPIAEKGALNISDSKVGQPSNLPGEHPVLQAVRQDAYGAGSSVSFSDGAPKSANSAVKAMLVSEPKFALSSDASAPAALMPGERATVVAMGQPIDSVKANSLKNDFGDSAVTASMPKMFGGEGSQETPVIGRAFEPLQAEKLSVSDVNSPEKAAYSRPAVAMPVGNLNEFDGSSVDKPLQGRPVDAVLPAKMAEVVPQFESKNSAEAPRSVAPVPDKASNASPQVGQPVSEYVSNSDPVQGHSLEMAPAAKVAGAEGTPSYPIPSSPIDVLHGEKPSVLDVNTAEKAAYTYNGSAAATPSENSNLMDGSSAEKAVRGLPVALSQKVESHAADTSSVSEGIDRKNSGDQLNNISKVDQHDSSEHASANQVAPDLAAENASNAQKHDQIHDQNQVEDIANPTSPRSQFPSSKPDNENGSTSPVAENPELDHSYGSTKEIEKAVTSIDETAVAARDTKEGTMVHASSPEALETDTGKGGTTGNSPANSPRSTVGNTMSDTVFGNSRVAADSKLDGSSAVAELSPPNKEIKKATNTDEPRLYPVGPGTVAAPEATKQAITYNPIKLTTSVARDAADSTSGAIALSNVGIISSMPTNGTVTDPKASAAAKTTTELSEAANSSGLAAAATLSPQLVGITATAKAASIVPPAESAEVTAVRGFGLVAISSTPKLPDSAPAQRELIGLDIAVAAIIAAAAISKAKPDVVDGKLSPSGQTATQTSVAVVDTHSQDLVPNKIVLPASDGRTEIPIVGVKNNTDTREMLGAEIVISALIAAAAIAKAKGDPRTPALPTGLPNIEANGVVTAEANLAATKAHSQELTLVPTTNADMASVLIASRGAKVGPILDSQLPALIIVDALSEKRGEDGEGSSLEDVDLSKQNSGNASATTSTAPIKVLTRPTCFITKNKTLVDISEDLYHNADLAWLIADLNAGHTKDLMIDGKRVVEFTSRQEIQLPVWEDIVEFQRNQPVNAVARNLITLVTEHWIDRELLNSTLDFVSMAPRKQQFVAAS